MRSVSRAAVILSGIVITSLLSMQVVSAASSEESDFYSRVNNERSSRGIASLSWNDSLAQVARSHSQSMADHNHLEHNANLGSDVKGWQVVGENVGYGGSVDDIHQAFMNSSPHRANILDTDYTEIGIGTVWKDGTLWVTEDFMRPQNQSSPARHSAPSRSSSSSSSSAPSSSSASDSQSAPFAPSDATPARQPQAALPPRKGLPAKLSSGKTGSGFASELTRVMVDHLEADDSAIGAAQNAVIADAFGSANSKSVLAISFGPFADIVARVNRAILFARH